MNFWNPAKLATDLRSGKLSEIQKFNYVVISAIIHMIVGSGSILRGHYTSLHLSFIFAYICVTLVGLNISFRVNQEGDGKFFLERYLCLSVPLIVLIYGISYLIYYLSFLNAAIEFVKIKLPGSQDALRYSFPIIALIIYYYNLQKYMRLASITTENVEQPLGVVVPTQQPAQDTEEKIGRGSYVVAFASFIPLLGALCGLIAIFWGLTTEKRGGRRVALIGFGGTFLCTILPYGILIYLSFTQNSFKDVNQTFARMQLNSLVQTIEFYKLQNGNYPESLETLRQSMLPNQTIAINDPMISTKDDLKPFHYELLDQETAYYLFSVGKDGLPFTQDDIRPELGQSNPGNIGLKFPTEKK